MQPLNGAASFDCFLGGDGNGNRAVIWRKIGDDGAIRTLFINETKLKAPARYRFTRPRYGGSGYRLTIDPITTDDDADYECEVQQLGKASAHLTVLGNCHCRSVQLFMAALYNRAGHYIFALYVASSIYLSSIFFFLA